MPTPPDPTTAGETLPPQKRERVLLIVHSGDAEAFCFVLKSVAAMYDKKGVITYVRNGKHGMEIFSLEAVQ